MKILVIEDEPKAGDYLRSGLTESGYVVDLARNGKDGLHMAQEFRYDLIVLDVMMPEMDGYETMRRIRKQPSFRTLPIIALTAKAMKGDREKCLEAGASDYVAKPVNTDQLLSLVRLWLHR